MGNCQAIDNASLVIQHPTGKSESLYSPISAAEVMKLNPGHCVALLLTTTVYSSRPPPSFTVPTKQNSPAAVATNGQPLRITRIKLLRPTETLSVGNIYRLVTTEEVMKGLMAKKNGKKSNNMKKVNLSEDLAGKHELVVTLRSGQPEMKKSESLHRRTASSSASALKPRGWHPALNSISEAST